MVRITILSHIHPELDENFFKLFTSSFYVGMVFELVRIYRV